MKKYFSKNLFGALACVFIISGPGVILAAPSQNPPIRLQPNILAKAYVQITCESLCENQYQDCVEDIEESIMADRFEASCEEKKVSCIYNCVWANDED